MDTGAAVTVEALTTAAQQGDAARLQQLLAQDANALSSIGPGGWTPLHLAVYFGHADAAEVLLAQGADVHAWSENDYRATSRCTPRPPDHPRTASRPSPPC